MATPNPPGFPPDTDQYTVSAWGGRPNYACRLCEMDSLDVAYILKHYQSHFLPVNDKDHRPVTRKSAFVDARGQPIMVMEPAETVTR